MEKRTGKEDEDEEEEEGDGLVEKKRMVRPRGVADVWIKTTLGESGILNHLE